MTTAEKKSPTSATNADKGKGGNGKGKGKKNKGQERPMVYPDVTSTLAVGGDAITVAQAKEMLEWVEEGDEGGGTFGNEYLLIDRNKKKIRCLNNINNRPLYMTKVEELVQEHLMKRWRFNGEPIIIGKTKQVLNGQHSLISLILAEQDRLGPQKHIWEAYWPGPVTMEKLVVYGVDEVDDVINTMDTCKPRSLTDVLYRMPFFARQTPKQRKASSRCLSFAVSLLWKRTGCSSKSFNIARLRTHAEALDWIDRHPHILQCVSHIMEKCGGTENLGKYISPGYAAGLLYLMGCSSSDGNVYRTTDPMREMKDKKTPILDWANWGAACDYWAEVAKGADDGEGGTVRLVLTDLSSSRTKGTVAERLAVLVQGWNVYAEGNKIVPSDLRLNYPEDKDGVPQALDYTPEVGGIDLGDPSEKEEEDKVDTREEDAADELGEEESEERDNIKEEQLAKKQHGRKAYNAMSEDEKKAAREEQRERLLAARKERQAATVSQPVTEEGEITETSEEEITDSSQEGLVDESVESGSSEGEEFTVEEGVEISTEEDEARSASEGIEAPVEG